MQTATCAARQKRIAIACRLCRQFCSARLAVRVLFWSAVKLHMYDLGSLFVSPCFRLISELSTRRGPGPCKCKLHSHQLLPEHLVSAETGERALPLLCDCPGNRLLHVTARGAFDILMSGTFNLCGPSRRSKVVTALVPTPARCP